MTFKVKTKGQNEGEKLLVPKLRFKEFKNEWNEITLKKLLSFKNGINGDKDSYGYGIKYISVGDILNNTYITYDKIKGLIDINDKTLKENSVEYGDMVFQRSSETFNDIGQANVYLDKKQIATFGGFVIRGKKIGNYNPLFFNYLLKSPCNRKKVIVKGAGAQHYNISQEELEKIINAGYSDVYIIGHSMGGVIASYLASKYKQVKKLVLAAPAFHYLAFKGDKVDVLESIKKLPNLFKNYNPEEVLSRLFKVPAPTIREFMKLVEEHTGDVKNITCPTLILHGDKDDIVPYDSVLYVYDNIKSKSVTLIELKTLTHDLFMNDRYEEVKGLIIKFFKTIPSNKKIQKKI